ncbi:hypothetical protein WJX74_011079 [Apatococcus lobatus]|uniref:Chromo domain-containing protein n=1 Tax=Apatococcus lobatus TaxID=904363 RepID=A0AAW1S3D0_9CHLO
MELTEEGRRLLEERARNIQRNAAMIAGLGINEHYKELEARAAAKQRAKDEARARSRQARLQRELEATPQQPLLEIRKSARCASQPAKCYKEEYPRCTQPPSLIKRSSRTRPASAAYSSSAARSNFHGPWQSDQAQVDAEEAADKAVANLKGAVVRRLQRSQVSGGFWMHLPPRSALSACMAQSKHTVTMTCSDATGPNTKYRFADKEVERPTWNVVHNVKPDGSTGLSGGWRGLAIDNVLTPNDSIVFEARYATESQAYALHIHCHIFRAKDYETAGYKPYWTSPDGIEVPSVQPALAAAPSVPVDGNMPLPAHPAGSTSSAGEGEGHDTAAAGPGVENVGPNVQAADGSEKLLVSKAAVAHQEAATKHDSSQQAGQQKAKPIFSSNINHKARPVATGAAAAPEEVIRAEAKRKRSAGMAAAQDDAAMDPKQPCKMTSRQLHDARQAQATCHTEAAGKEAVPINNAAKAKTGSKSRTSGESDERQQKRHRKSGAPEVEGPSDDPDEFWVSQIQDFKHEKNGKLHFKVRWWGYGADEDTWEPADNLPDGPLTYNWSNKRRRAVCASLLAVQ